MSKEKLFYVGVKALVQNDQGEILVLKSSLRNHSAGVVIYWDIPGGRIEEGGNALDTLKREMEEETGIKEISEVKFKTVVISHHEIPIDESRNAGLVLMLYTVKISPDAEIILSDEHTEYGWVEPGVAAERLANKYPAEFTSTL